MPTRCDNSLLLAIAGYENQATKRWIATKCDKKSDITLNKYQERIVFSSVSKFILWSLSVRS